MQDSYTDLLGMHVVMKNSWLMHWESVFGSFQSLQKSSASIQAQFTILILTLITCAEADFTLFPTSQVVPSEAQQTIFYCKYPTAEGIGWRVNGISLGRMPHMGITPCTNPRLDGMVIDRLKIELNPDYNGYTVECVAFFLDRPAAISAPAANLTIQDGGTFEMGFIINPHSQIQNMTELVLVAGEEATFECQYCVTEDISWVINGQTLDELNLPENIAIVRHYDIRPYCGALHMLTISNISNYNLSTIQCGPGVGSSDEVSEAITLWVQGVLNPIQSIQKTVYDKHSVYEWNAPFSLNLTGIDPDVLYCVSIYDVTCLNQSDLIFIDNNCSIINPNYTTSIGNLNPNKRFEIFVSPKLNSVNAFNTTIPAKYEDQFIHLDSNAVTFNITISSNSGTAQLAGVLNLEAAGPLDIRPGGYAMELKSVEPENQGENEKCSMFTHDSNLETDIMVSWTVNCSSPIQIKRLFLCKIYAFMMKSGCYVPISSATELSTHIIQNVRVASTSHHGELVVHADFIQTTSVTSLGYMAIVYSNHSDIYYKVARRQYDQSSAAVKFSGLPGNTYRVSVFNIEPDGLLSTTSASISKNESIVGVNNFLQGETDNFLHIEYMHMPDNCCVHCVFSNKSISYCLFIVMEKSQLTMESRLGLLDIQIRKVLNTTKECIENCAEYAVVAFGYSSDLEMLIGSGVELTFDIEQMVVSDIRHQSTNATLYGLLVIAAVFAVIPTVVIMLLIAARKKGKFKAVRIQVAVHHPTNNSDDEGLISF